MSHPTIRVLNGLLAPWRGIELGKPAPTIASAAFRPCYSPAYSPRIPDPELKWPCGRPRLALLPAQALAGAKEKIAALAPSGLVLVMDAKGNELIAQNADEPFVPASVTKIVTVWLALEVLGGDYRFQTRFYLDDKRVLYVRGGGDPFLISEELALLAPELVAAIGKQPLTGIVLDASYFPAELRIPGVEDTKGLRCPELGARGELQHDQRRAQAATRSSPPRSRRRSPRSRSISSGRGAQGPRPHQPAQDPALSLRYAGELLAAFIKQAGGSVSGKITTGSVPAGLDPVYVHSQSRPLSKILRELLVGSNNYIANQVFLEIGAHKLGGPVSLEKSLKVAREMLAAHDLAKAIYLEEGSGIATATASRRAALSRCSTCSRPTRACSSPQGCLVQDRHASRACARLRATPTPPARAMRFVISLKGNNGAMRFELLKAIESGL